MKYLFFLILAIFFSDFSLLAQTQKIAHKSHSGTAKTFVLNSKSKDNLGIPSGYVNFSELEEDSLVIVSFLEDSMAGKEWIKLFKSIDTHDEFVEKMKEDYIKDIGLHEKLQSSKTGFYLLEACHWFGYEEIKKYILGLLERHKKDTPNGKSGSILKKTDKIKDYTSLSLLIGIACAGFWLYRQGKIV